MNKWSRRGLITTGVLAGGVFAVGVAIRPGNRLRTVSKLVAGEGETLVNVWVKIGEDNRVTAIIPHSEMGQGVMTSLGAMLADEMDADWDRLDMQQAPADNEYANWIIARYFLAPGLRTPGIVEDTIDGAFLKVAQSMSFQTTGGSMSVRATGTHGLRIAGAAARQMLVEAAAQEWGVPPSSLRTENSTIFDDANHRSAPYAQFAAAAAEITAPRYPKLKTPSQFRVMGKSMPRVDLPAKVDGSAKFGIDTVLPKMAYATVRAAPVFGAQVASVKDAAARAMPGVLKVLRFDTFVAVVAESYWRAREAVDALDIEWTKTGKEGVTSESIFATHLAAVKAAETDGPKIDVNTGDAIAALSSAARKIEAEYRVPFLAHATMEPMNATAWVHDGVCEVWAGMQNPLGSRYALAKATGIDVENIRIHNAFLGGGFGRRGRPDYTNQAGQIAQKVDRPVKLIWSREEDTRHDHYRPAVLNRMKAALGTNGLPVSWISTYVEKHDPAEAPRLPYAIPNQKIGYAKSTSHVPFGAWRSVDHSQHGFFVESFIDECAHAAGEDPYVYRRKLLSGMPRHLAVIDRVAKLAGWGAPLAPGHGRGIALVESFSTIVAQVAEVDLTGAQPKVVNVWCVADPGYAINPDGFAAQMESGIIFGLSAALYGEITIRNGAVEQASFPDYPVIRMDTAPKIQVEIINSGADVGGGGEPGTPPIAPAVTNAIFAASGKRLRELPVAKAAALTVGVSPGGAPA